MLPYRKCSTYCYTLKERPLSIHMSIYISLIVYHSKGRASSMVKALGYRVRMPQAKFTGPSEALNPKTSKPKAPDDFNFLLQSR